MNDPGLIDAFNDCIDRLAAGESLENCLRRFPEYARALRPMLEVGIAVRRAQILPFETDAAEMRVRARVIEALSAPTRRPVSPITRLLPLVATLILVLGAVIGGSALLSRINQTDMTPTPAPITPPTASPTPTAAITVTATLSPTPTETATASATQSATQFATRTPSLTETAAGCVVTPLGGWSSYQIQAGDTLSDLAARAGVTLDEVVHVNCLTDARLIVVGQQVFLPPLAPPFAPTFAPPFAPTAAPSSTSAPQPTPTEEHDGGDDNGSDNSGDDHGGSGGNDNGSEYGNSNDNENSNDNAED